MSGKNLKVALQVKADLDQARREIKGLNQDLKDVSQTSLSTSTAQQKVSRTAVLTAAEMQKMSGATNLKAGINQLSDYEIWLKKTSMANLDASRTSQLFENSVRSLTPHLLSLIGISGTFVGIAVDTLNKAAELQNLSNVSGMNVEQFQYYVTGAKKVGVEQEKLADIFKDTRDKVGDFIATGGGEMADFFENIAPKVGVTVEQFKKLNGQEALQLYVDTLQKAGVSQNEMVFYLEAIANDATLLLPLLNQGGESWKKYGDAAQSAGAILGQGTVDEAVKAKQALGNLQTSVSGVTNTLVANAAPAITFVAQNLDVLVKAGLLVASVYAGKMVSSVAAATISFVVGRIEAIRYQMALANMAGVATTTAARLTALSTVSRLLTVAGGLPGLAIAAAGVAASFLLMPRSSDAATLSLDTQGLSVDELREKYEQLSAIQKDTAIHEVKNQIEELSLKFRVASSDLFAFMEGLPISDDKIATFRKLNSQFSQGKIDADTYYQSIKAVNVLNDEQIIKVRGLIDGYTNSKSALAQKNLELDVYTGKTGSAATASSGLSGSLDGVGSSADGATSKIQGLSKAFEEYIKRTKDGIVSNTMQTSLMDKYGYSESAAKALADARIAKGDINDRSLDLTVKERDLILANIAAEEKRNKLVQQRREAEQKTTKEKEKQAKFSDLRIKSSEAIAGGKTHQGTIELAKLVQETFNIRHFSAFNDKYHQGKGGKHPQGLAFDFSLRNPKESSSVTASIRKIMADAGVSGSVLDEYKAPSKNATGGHIHVSFTTATDAHKFMSMTKQSTNKLRFLGEDAQDFKKQLEQQVEEDKQQKNKRITLRELYYSEEEKALAEHNRRIAELNKAGYSKAELKELLEKENQRYEEVISKRPEILKRVQESMSALDESWLRASGEGLEADLKAVEEKWKQSKADIASLMMSESDPLQANRYQNMLVKIDFIIDKEKLTLQFNDAMKQIEDLKAQHEERKNALKLQFESGEVNQFQYAENLRNLEADLRPQFMSLIEMARELALQLDDAFSVQKLDNLAAGMERAQSSTKSFIPTVEQLAERFSDGLTNAIFDWIDGTKSASDAFREFASSFLREIAQMILKQLIFNATKAALGAMGVGFSSGGYTGAGGKYDVAGVVHKDEFVIRKESTSQQGAKEFLNYFNIYGMEALNKFRGYSTGGLVTAPEISMPPNIQTPQLTNPAETIAQSTSFNANQNFYLVDDPKRILDTLNSSQGQENIVVMMSRDPAKFKSALKIG
ncbi:hypothetical protein LZP46_01060 [Acinetobacter sp. SCLZS86]|uniref:phage tail tape measure C-terminal domain-containing protein n=1 Tax=Acinetobacter sp. SCLZS86 TaxID=2908637 RepID=UPI001F1D8F80|nr:phage tail tape measure C-terminal domain-containing protein [Acinetobacter sp. SCLZS86]UIZ57777.1 hypothetical protein LZP46_01060 [Acinetobacter sp. SCLZS86]